jgi:hypothetical protein
VVAWSFLSTSVLTINKEEYRFSEDAETTAYDSCQVVGRQARGARVLQGCGACAYGTSASIAHVGVRGRGATDGDACGRWPGVAGQASGCTAGKGQQGQRGRPE